MDLVKVAATGPRQPVWFEFCTGPTGMSSHCFGAAFQRSGDVSAQRFGAAANDSLVDHHRIDPRIEKEKWYG